MACVRRRVLDIIGSVEGVDSTEHQYPPLITSNVNTSDGYSRYPTKSPRATIDTSI